MRAVGVGQPQAQPLVLPVADRVVGDLRGAHERGAQGVRRVGVGEVQLDAEAGGQRLLHLQLDALHLAGDIGRRGDRVGLELVVELAEVGGL